MRLEGSGASKLVQLVREIGYNKDVDIELATVTAPPPNLKIKVDNMSVELQKDDLVVAEWLTRHRRRVTITNSRNTNISTNYPTSTGGFEHPEENPAESYNFDSFNVNNASFITTEAEVEFLDELKQGDKVIVASVNKGQLFVVLDRAVTY